MVSSDPEQLLEIGQDHEVREIPAVDRHKERTASGPLGEDDEVLAGLRSGWLEDFETALRQPPPPPVPLSQKLREGLSQLADGFSFWFQSGKRIVLSASSRKLSPAPQPAEPLASTPERRPIVPSGSPADPVQEGVVLDLRDSWLADVEAAPEKYAARPVPWHSKLYREFEPIAGELAYWLDCFLVFGVHLMTPKVKKRRVLRGEKARRAEAAARFLSATIVVAMVAATVLYVASVTHIFNAKHLAQVLGQ